MRVGLLLRGTPRSEKKTIGNEKETRMSRDDRLQKKAGPVPSAGPVAETHIHLPPALHAWAKDEPEGLSGLIRSLVLRERDRREHVQSNDSA